MKRVFIAALALASVSYGKEWKPDEIQISDHRREVYMIARDYVVETFNLQLIEESEFNPIRFDSHGVWGNFEARLKELGDNRFEVQGWFNARGHDSARTRWTVHLRYRLDDPEAWRYQRVDAKISNKPEFLGWKFGMYYSLGYEANYDPAFVASIYKR